MRASPLFLFAGLTMSACDRAADAGNEASASPQPLAPEAVAACMRNLPGDPIVAARADVSRGIVHLYSHEQNGEASGPVTPGVYNCPGPAPPRDGYKVDWVELPVSIDEARTRELMAHTADMPEILDACGERQNLYMRRYNLEVIRLRPPAVRSQCRGMNIEADIPAGR
jgi:hypothetical protein